MSTIVLYALYALLAYLGFTSLLLLLSVAIPTLGFYGRLLASHLALFVVAAYGVVASIVLRLVGYGRVSQWATARAFKWVMLLATGVRFEVEGKEHLQTRPAVFVGNHQSELDVLMLGEIFPPYCSVTAKKSLRLIPIFGWFMALSGTVFIDRSNRENAMAAFEGAAAEMRRDKQSVFIFAEGTRSYSSQPDLLPFKKGAFHLAVKAKVPIVPIVTANYSNVLDVKRKRFVSGVIPVKVLPPIDTKDLTPADVEDLTRDTRDLMLSELVRVTERARQAGVSLPADEAKAVDQKHAIVNGASPRQRRDGKVKQAI
ncbi:MAG: 1-acylglycerol-3-phosphate O-acyltransferase [Caeruleum heppii]|nr:MAG: 1-acylglycerol-3-phosphate O-acyltransferase [Caeruleum heppii]